jgi:hypothetical protein
MKRIAQIAVPLLVLAALGGAALAVYRRRASRTEVPRYRVETGTPLDRQADAAGNASAGVEVLVGYDEEHEEEEEARHGALLHIDVGKLSVGQF